MELRLDNGFHGLYACGYLSVLRLVRSTFDAKWDVFRPHVATPTAFP